MDLRPKPGCCWSVRLCPGRSSRSSQFAQARLTGSALSPPALVPSPGRWSGRAGADTKLPHTCGSPRRAPRALHSMPASGMERPTPHRLSWPEQVGEENGGWTPVPSPSQPGASGLLKHRVTCSRRDNPRLHPRIDLFPLDHSAPRCAQAGGRTAEGPTLLEVPPGGVTTGPFSVEAIHCHICWWRWREHRAVTVQQER